MSRTRYYPVSQLFLNDAETWEMRDTFGDRSVFFWMSLLSAGEMDEGNIHGTPPYIARIHGQYLDRTHPQRAQNVLLFLTNKGWLTPLLKDGLTVGYFITNYWKYHRRPDRVTQTNPHKLSTSPILSEPSEPSVSKDTEEVVESDEISIQDFTDSWNEVFANKLPQVEWPVSQSRRHKIRARLREHPDVPFWNRVFGNIGRSSFLLGTGNSRNGHENWKCTMDFLIANDTNCMKIWEGQYDQNRK